MATEEKTKMYFINKTKGKVGSFYPLAITRTPTGNETDKVEITFEVEKTSKDKIDYYFNEQEWLDDIRKM